MCLGVHILNQSLQILTDQLTKHNENKVIYFHHFAIYSSTIALCADGFLQPMVPDDYALFTIE